MKKPKKRPLAFVIIHYNDLETTKRLLLNIKDYKSITKIYVIDNGSTDHSYEKLKQQATDKITVYRAKENKGFAAGLNEGAHLAIEELGDCDIIFSNSDVIIYSDENLKVLQETSRSNEIGVLGPVIYEQEHLNRGWKIPTAREEIFINLPVIGRYFKKKYSAYKEAHYQDKISFVDTVSGCFFLIKSEVLKAIDYFDEGTFLYYEEPILARKMETTNKKIAVCNEITIIHDHSVSINKNISTINKFKELKKSQLYFEEHYNKATSRELFLLKASSRLTLITLYVRVFIKGGFRKKKEEKQ